MIRITFFLTGRNDPINCQLTIIFWITIMGDADHVSNHIIGSVGGIVGAVGLALAVSNNRAAQARAADARVAASIHRAAASAHADGNASLYAKLLASDANVERLEGQVDSLVAQRTEILREVAVLLAENAALRARAS